jgi:hypothetical protein
MRTSFSLRRTASAVVTAALLAAALTACSGGSDEPGGAASDASASPSAEPPYLEVPEGVELTTRGTRLAVGDPATVAWQPSAEQIGAVTIAVTKLERVSLKTLAAWTLNSRTRRSQPYFVRAKVTNVGDKKLDQLQLPLYAVIGDNTYVTASSFNVPFKPCPSVNLPAKFKPGTSANLCWVYLAPDHGKLAGVSFYPGPWFDPIVWEGPVARYVAPKPKPTKG